MPWTIDDFRRYQSEAQKKADYWDDLKRRHAAKCDNCKEERESGYGLGCDKWVDMDEKRERHQSRADDYKSRVYRAEQAALRGAPDA